MHDTAARGFRPGLVLRACASASALLLLGSFSPVVAQDAAAVFVPSVIMVVDGPLSGARVAPPIAPVRTYGAIEDALAQERRRRRPSVVGGIAGFVVGAAAGGLIGCALNRDSYGVFCGGQNDTKVVVSAAIGGIAGATAGALIFARPR